MARPSDKPNSDPMAAVVIPIGILVIVTIIWVANQEGLYYGAAKMAYWMLAPFSWMDKVQEYRLSIMRDVVALPDPFVAMGWAAAAWRAPSAILAIICFYAAWKSMKNPILKMRGPITVDALLRYQAQVHSPIAPIVPIAMDIHKNLDERFHESYHPHEVVQKFNLAKADGTLDREKCERYFIGQLGSRIYRPGLDDSNTIFADRLNNYEKAIFAMLAPLAIKIKEGLPEYIELRDALNYSAVNETQTPDLRLAQKMFDEYRAHPKLNNLFRAFHFSNTYLMQLYLLAKRSGKVTTADWVGWLRPNAHQLYVALNTAGRNVAFTESGGVFAHWKFERKCQTDKRMPVLPAVVDAIDDLHSEWEFWKKSDKRVTEETLWGRMDDGAKNDQDLFRRYVSEILTQRSGPLPEPGSDTLFDSDESQARKSKEDEALAKMMSGLAHEFPQSNDPA